MAASTKQYNRQKAMYDSGLVSLTQTRENKTLEALQKLQELKAKYYKTENALQ